MKVKRKIIEIDEALCDGCGQCVTGCAEGALEIIDGKARVIADKFCDGLGACIGECPTGALKIVWREADEFDEAAVEEHLAQHQDQRADAGQPAASGCPSTRLTIFAQNGPQRQAPDTHRVEGENQNDQGSALSHWPVQIKLVPPNAPFLKDADLLVTADCVPLAFPTFHRDFLQGKVVLLGCPKLDDAAEYIDKFAQIFAQSRPKRISTVVMEVPCCSGLPIIIKRGMEKAGISLPMEVVVVSTRGRILERKAAVA